MSAQAGPSRRTRNRGEPASVCTLRPARTYGTPQRHAGKEDLKLLLVGDEHRFVGSIGALVEGDGRMNVPHEGTPGLYRGGDRRRGD